MIIISPLSSTFNFYFIPSQRINIENFDLQIINTITLNTELITAEFTESGDYVKCTATVSESTTLTDQNFYKVIIEEGLHIVYKDSIFCSTQLVDQKNNFMYSINNPNTYVEKDSGKNSYIVI